MRRSGWLEYVSLVVLVGLVTLAAQFIDPLPPVFPHPDPKLPRWRGAPVWKRPGELCILQEIIYSVKPDVIIETGSYKGGSALFLASLLDLDGKGRVVSIDITDWQPKPAHQRITYPVGSSTAPAIVN